MKEIVEKNGLLIKELPQHGSYRTGTQSIERALVMLRVVASRGRNGMRLGEVAATSGLPQSTCFRMLQRLQIEGLVDRDATSRKYFLGPLLYELGLLAQPRYRLADLCDAALRQLAEQTGDTIYLSERSGLEAVCTNRALGDYPIKALSLDVGIRRPLGVGAGGLAILCAMPPAQAEEIIQANGHRYEKFATFNADFLRAAVIAGRQRGYSLLDSAVAPGMAAVGVAFPADNPVAAISVAAISGRLMSPRREDVASQIQRQVQRICTTLTGSTAASL